MKRITILSILMFSLCSILPAQKSSVKIIPQTVIFKVKPEHKSVICKGGFSHTELEQIIVSSGAQFVSQKFPNCEVPSSKFDKLGRKYSDLSTIFELKISEGQNINKTISALANLDIIEYAHPYYLPELLYVPDDPLNVDQQWYIEKIKAYEAFDIHQGDSSFVIGITDTGTDIDHPDLIYNISYNMDDQIDGIDNDLDGYIDNFRGWDLAENDNNPQADSLDHGTLVSGLCAPRTDNGTGLTGAAFKCKFLPLKISNDYNQLTMSYEGIVYAANHGCKVINCSWGSTAYMGMGQDIVNYATINCDALVVGACGNNDDELLFYPASYEYVLSVAASTELDQKWSPDNTGTTGGSTYNYMVDISAPGAMVYTANNGGYTMGWGGTSFAAPIVSGAAALVWSYFPNLNALQVGELLKISTDVIDTLPDNLEYAGKLGTGRLNMYKALTMEQTPAIVLENISIEDDRENDYENSDTVRIMGNLINYLAPANNLNVHVSCENENISLITTLIPIGYLNTLENFAVEEPSIMFEMLPGMDYNSTVFVKLDFEADNYSKTQYIEVFVKPSYKNLDANNIAVSIPGNGRIGYHDLSSTKGLGLTYTSGESLFYDCGLIIANSTEKVLSSVRQSTDFFTLDQPQKSEPGIVADQDIITKFDDTNDLNNFGIEVVTNAMSWETDDYSNFVIIEYSLINKGSLPIEDLYIGIFSDWDIVEPAANKADYDNENELFYFWYTGAQSMYCGMQLLSSHDENHYALDNIAGGDGVVDITDDFTDSEKYYLISNSSNQAGLTGIGSDVVGTISAGPINIDALDTVVVAFALHVENSLYNMINSSQKADYLYNEVLHPSSINENDFESLIVFPNPASEIVEIIIPQVFQNEKFILKISDVRGKTIIEENYNSGVNTVSLDTKISEGVYIISVESSSMRIQEKLIIEK